VAERSDRVSSQISNDETGLGAVVADEYSAVGKLSNRENVRERLCQRYVRGTQSDLARTLLKRNRRREGGDAQ
jgi:hypothetical protein